MINAILGWVKSAMEWVLSFLPKSPFTAVLNAIEDIPFLDALNWFIPVSTFVAIGEAWLVAIGVYYLYSIVLRWIKAV